jgi:hypothetical protein
MCKFALVQHKKGVVYLIKVYFYIWQVSKRNGSKAKVKNVLFDI